MAVVAFDTLKLADRLQAGGFTADQARAAASAFADAMVDSDLATKVDLAAVKAELKADIAAVKAELKADIAAVNAELKADVAAVKADLIALESRLEAKFAELKTEIVRTTSNQVLTAMVLNIVAVVTAFKLLSH